jgi:hypothetical protein
MSKCVPPLILLFLSLLLPCSSSAQEDSSRSSHEQTKSAGGNDRDNRAAISGVVTYKDGKPAAGVQVTLLDTISEESSSTYTNSEGRYEFMQLHSGNYQLQVIPMRSQGPEGEPAPQAKTLAKPLSATSGAAKGTEKEITLRSRQKANCNFRIDRSQ